MFRANNVIQIRWNTSRYLPHLTLTSSKRNTWHLSLHICPFPQAQDILADVILNSLLEIIIGVKRLASRWGGNRYLFLSKALSPIILKSLFLLPPIRAAHAERGGGERTGHLHQLANHSGELIRAACSPEAWCCVGTTSDTTSVPSPSTLLRQRARAAFNCIFWQPVTTQRCPDVRWKCCPTRRRWYKTSHELNPLSGLLDPLIESRFFIQTIKQLRLIMASHI